MFEIKKDQFEYILHTFSVDPRLLKTKMANNQSESVEKVVHIHYVFNRYNHTTYLGAQ